jgi:L-lactate dehydrogenase complex protein LldE
VDVSLFVTCVVDLFEPDIGQAVVDVLRAMDVRVDVPEGQTCCGQPAWNSGFATDAARVAATSLDALDAAGGEVVVPAGSCATMIRVFWPELFELVGDHERVERATRLARRTHEFAEFVEQHRDRLPELRPLDESVAYHHSCHMLRELDIETAPGALLAEAGCSTETWSADRRCCGFGGLFSFKLPETSTAMADDKLTSLPGSAIDGVVGCDASCLLHLRSRGEHEHLQVRTRHLAQVLAAALAKPGR